MLEQEKSNEHEKQFVLDELKKKKLTNLVLSLESLEDLKPKEEIKEQYQKLDRDYAKTERLQRDLHMSDRQIDSYFKEWIEQNKNSEEIKQLRERILIALMKAQDDQVDYGFWEKQSEEMSEEERIKKSKEADGRAYQATGICIILGITRKEADDYRSEWRGKHK